MTNEELISKYYDGNMQALYDLYEQNVGFIQSVAAAVAKDYKNYLRFSDTFEYNVPLVKTQMKKIIVTAKTLYSHPKNVSKIYAALHTDLAW